jgi:hypothetical protein
VKLKSIKPSGIAITTDALEKFKVLKVQEEAAVVVKDKLKKAKKDIKKKEKHEVYEKEYDREVEHGEFDYYHVDPGVPGIWTRYIAPEHKGPNCQKCSSPVYPNECLDPPLCIWCE